MRPTCHLTSVQGARHPWLGFGIGMAGLAFAVLPLTLGTRTETLLADERPSLVDMNQESSLLREGTAWTETLGRFQTVKERTIFHDERTGRRYICLENLMLQRVESFLTDDEDRRHRWLVSGKLTEYQGNNYLWMDRAVRAR
jgi:hypothetical protein